MAKSKSKLTTVCQDCLNDIPDKVVQKHFVPINVGPAHYIYLCKNCKSKREKK